MTEYEDIEALLLVISRLVNFSLEIGPHGHRTPELKEFISNHRWCNKYIGVGQGEVVFYETVSQEGVETWIGKIHPAIQKGYANIHPGAKMLHVMVGMPCTFPDNTQVLKFEKRIDGTIVSLMKD